MIGTSGSLLDPADLTKVPIRRKNSRRKSTKNPLAVHIDNSNVKIEKVRRKSEYQPPSMRRHTTL